jgi:quercetin dioxygenase-like cupin family protein
VAHDRPSMQAGTTDGTGVERLSVVGDDVLLRVVDAGDVEVVEYVSSDRDGPPPHSHPWDEIEFVIEGDVEFLVGDRWSRGGPGTVQMLPRGVAHAVRIPTGTARILMITLGPPYAGFAREVAALGVTGYPDPATLLEIAGRHGLRLATPTDRSAGRPDTV